MKISCHEVDSFYCLLNAKAASLMVEFADFQVGTELLPNCFSAVLLHYPKVKNYLAAHIWTCRLVLDVQNNT